MSIRVSECCFRFIFLMKCPVLLESTVSMNKFNYKRFNLKSPLLRPTILLKMIGNAFKNINRLAMPTIIITGNLKLLTFII